MVFVETQIMCNTPKAHTKADGDTELQLDVAAEWEYKTEFNHKPKLAFNKMHTYIYSLLVLQTSPV